MTDDTQPTTDVPPVVIHLELPEAEAAILLEALAAAGILLQRTIESWSASNHPAHQFLALKAAACEQILKSVSEQIQQQAVRWMEQHAPMMAVAYYRQEARNKAGEN